MSRILQKRKRTAQRQSSTASAMARLDFRLPRADKELLERASILDGITLSEFVLRTVRQKAKEVIVKESTLGSATKEDVRVMIDVLLDKTPPNKALIDLMRARAYPGSARLR